MAGVEAATRAQAPALSCLTVNLAAYLHATEADPYGRIARSVRLAVRTDLPDDLLAFSHHRYSLGHRGDGRFLAYRATSDVATLLGHLEERIDRDGSVLVVTYAGAMRWSLAEATDRAPHLVRITARHRRWWHVNDAFTALLPAGEQPAFDGWITTTDLCQAMAAPHALEPQHRLRQQHVFGDSVTVPGGGRFRWLAPTVEDPSTAIPAPPHWLTDPPQVLDFLAGYFAGLDGHPERVRFIDDLWAAAQHHTFRYTHLLEHCPLDGDEHDAVEAAMAAWTNLPMSLHFAADSARRGRPRPSLVTAVFTALDEAEKRCAPIVDRYGYLRADAARG
jgi:hypothetical protein